MKTHWALALVKGIREYMDIIKQLYMATHSYSWLYMVIHGFTLQCMAILGNTWLYTAKHGHIRLYIAIHDNTWLYTAIHGYTRLYTAIHSHKNSNYDTL